ncbi:polyprenyl synthetase family protein [Nocardia harenae]|uniref:polyprenyl synthetase family protein n=1 Tax=Nocardia harenae TaxID=358707 RepID=UPI00082ECEE2|nr:polyprenyl synthetase family protein [Nocardia harenae]
MTREIAKDHHTDTFAQGRAACAATLRSAVHTMPPTIRHIAGYHFGWWDRDGRPEQHAGGKALRPAFVLAATTLTGGDVADAGNAAAAVELVHNFSLLHDDVMDRDTTRRHRPTAWAVFGVGPAILAGDALASQAFALLTATADGKAAAAAELLDRAVLELVEGQCADLSFEGRRDVTVTECLAMTDRKTGALFGCAAELGGLFGAAGPGELLRLREIGRLVGRAFQHVDDLLGIWGDVHSTGKPVYSDLRRRKKSLPVVFALNSGTAEGAALAALYHREQPLDDAELLTAADLVEAAGGRAWSREQAAELCAGARSMIAELARDPAAGAELDRLAALAADRTW